MFKFTEEVSRVIDHADSILEAVEIPRYMEVVAALATIAKEARDKIPPTERTAAQKRAIGVIEKFRRFS